MKTLKELGTSPMPWSANVRHPGYVLDADDEVVVKKLRGRDARLIAAAPDCYEALREAVVQTCLYCKSKKCEDCKVVGKWRATLAKASGEEEKE